MQNKPIHNENEAEIMLLADCSSSLAPCFETLKNVLQNTYSSLCKNYSVGVGVYAETFQNICAPDVYKKEISDVFQNLKPAYKSNLRDALCGVADCFDLSKNNRKAIIVFTDGGFDGADPFCTAEDIRSAGIELHAIGFTGAIDCLYENLNKLTNGACADSDNAAPYIDSAFADKECGEFEETEEQSTETSCNCCNREIFIEADVPYSEGYYTVNVQINGSSCCCNASALCVRLILGRRILSEKFIYAERGRTIPATVTFIVPEYLLPTERDVARLHAQVYGNPIIY